MADFTVDAIILDHAGGTPGGRVLQSDWLGHSDGGLFIKTEAPKSTYAPVSQIYDQGEVPRLVNKELEILDMFTN